LREGVLPVEVVLAWALRAVRNDVASVELDVIDALLPVSASLVEGAAPHPTTSYTTELLRTTPAGAFIARASHRLRRVAADACDGAAANRARYRRTGIHVDRVAVPRLCVTRTPIVRLEIVVVERRCVAGLVFEDDVGNGRARRDYGEHGEHGEDALISGHG
jgi:hypothetical protein